MLDSRWEPPFSWFHGNRKSHPASRNSLSTSGLWPRQVREGTPGAPAPGRWLADHRLGCSEPAEYVHCCRTGPHPNCRADSRASPDKPADPPKKSTPSRREPVFLNHHRYWISSILSVFAKLMGENWKAVLNCMSLFLVEAEDFFHLNTDYLHFFCANCLD